MKRRAAATALILLICFAGCTRAEEHRIVGYYTAWSAYRDGVLIADIDGSLLTHLNYAFVNMNGDGSLSAGFLDPAQKDAAEESFRSHCQQFAYLKERYPHLKIILSVGGWTGSQMFSDVAADAQKRQTFARSAGEWICRYGFDGLDIDWEYPVQGGSDIPHRPQDRENYTLLVQAVRLELDRLSEENDRQYLLSIAGASFPAFTVNTQLAELCSLLDYINIMSYDYHGAWDERTGANAPLYGSSKSVDETVRAYLQSGAESAKLNLGIPFYGRGWTGVDTSVEEGWNQPGARAETAGPGRGTWEGSTYAYWDLAANYIGRGYTRGFDIKTRTPYLYNDDTWISYDDEESIAYKVNYCLRRGLGGVMFWEFAADKEKVLQRAVAKSLGVFGK